MKGILRLCSYVFSTALLIGFFWLMDFGYIALMGATSLTHGFWELVFFWMLIGLIWYFFKYLASQIIGYILVPLQLNGVGLYMIGGILNGIFLIYKIWVTEIQLTMLEMCAMHIVALELMICNVLGAIGISDSFNAKQNMLPRTGT